MRVLIFVASLLMSAAVCQAQSVTADELEIAWQHCKTKTRPFPSATPMWQPGWESCATVWERYAPIEAERKRREQEAKDAEIKALINRAGRPK